MTTIREIKSARSKVYGAISKCAWAAGRIKEKGVEEGVSSIVFSRELKKAKTFLRSSIAGMTWVEAAAEIRRLCDLYLEDTSPADKVEIATASDIYAEYEEKRKNFALIHTIERQA